LLRQKINSNFLGFFSHFLHRDCELVVVARLVVTRFAVDAEQSPAGKRVDQELRLALRQALPGNDLRLPVIWTWYQFPLPLPSCNLKLSQSKVKT
jgi:hypothetical protein